MGYTLTIGELEVNYDQDDEYPDIHLGARAERHDNAPAYGEPTDYTNARWPSYTSWHEFTRFVGLEELFFSDDRGDCLIGRQHPGCVPLTERHRREINAAYEAHKVKYPNAVPTYGNPPEGVFTVDENNPPENYQFTRLTWLHYWVNWALDNCEKPVFENS